jgi:hypothetical protein
LEEVMKALQNAVLIAVTLTSVAFAQTYPTGSATTGNATQATTQAEGATAQSSTAAAAQGGAIVPVELPRSIDSKKAKVGDEVIAKVISDVRSGGAVAIPRGSKLVGKITEVNARAKGDATSSLGIVFDKAVLKNGSTLNLVSTIQAVIAPPQAAPSSLSDSGAGIQTPPGGGSSGGGDMVGSATGAVGNTAGSAVGAVGNTAGSALGTAGSDLSAAGSVGANAPVVTSRTSGVVGIKGLELNTSADSQASGSVLTSGSKSVKLDSGTRLLVNVSAATPGSAEKPEESKK